MFKSGWISSIIYPAKRSESGSVPLCRVPHHIEAKAFVNRQILQETNLSFYYGKIYRLLSMSLLCLQIFAVLKEKIFAAVCYPVQSVFYPSIGGISVAIYREVTGLE